MICLAQLAVAVLVCVRKVRDVYLGFLFLLLKSLWLLLAPFPSASLLPLCSCAVSPKLIVYDLSPMLMVAAIAFFLDPASPPCFQSARMERGVGCSHCRW